MCMPWRTELGGFYNLVQGVCNAILLPVVWEYNIIACPKRFEDIAVALGQDVSGLSDLEAGEKAIRAIRQLSSAVGIPSGLAELGVLEQDLEVMAVNAKKDACQLTNPRTATLTQVVGMYRSAMGDAGTISIAGERAA